MGPGMTPEVAPRVPAGRAMVRPAPVSACVANFSDSAIRFEARLAVHHPSRSHSRAEFWRGGRKRAGGGSGSPALDDLRERFGHKFMFVDAHEKAATEPQKQNIPGPTVRLNE